VGCVNSFRLQVSTSRTTDPNFGTPHELEAPYTPRYDFQGVCDDSELARISARLGIKPAGS